MLLACVGRAAARRHSAPTCCPMPIEFDFSIDGTVLAFAVRVSMATPLLFGLAPAWSASQPGSGAGAQGHVDGDGSARRRITLRDVLVVGPAGAVAGAARGGRAAGARPAGARGAPTSATTRRGSSSLSFNLQMNGYDDDRAAGVPRARAPTLRALPGVTAVSFATRLPLAPDINMDGIRVPGHHAPDRTTARRSTRSGSAPTTSPSWACRSWPAARSPKTRSLRAGGRDRQRDDGAPVLARTGGRRPARLHSAASTAALRDRRRGARSQGAVGRRRRRRPYMHRPADAVVAASN